MADQSDSTPETASAPVGAQISALWGRLKGSQRVVIIAAVVGLLGALGWMVSRDQGVPQGVLFSGLSANDAGRIVQELQARKIPYEVDNGGTAITVPEDQVHELRLTLSAEGVSPSGAGVGFELFDNQPFGTTSFVERMNFRRALEGELSRTIASLGTVERARVHIAMGKRSLYSRESEPPSASVVLSMRAGQQLSRGQRRGILNMVAASVDGLTPDNVTLVDGNGTALTSPEGEALGPDGSMDLERNLAQRVERMLEAVVGHGNVAVTVTAELDRELVERTEETYDQVPEAKIVRNEQRTISGGGAGAGNVAGIAGAQGNLPGTTRGGGGAAGGGGAGGGQNIAEATNYEVNRTVQKTVGPKQRLKRLHLAVLVDEPVGEEGTPIPRTEAELSRISAIAREAAGLDAERGDKIEVHSVPFVRAPALEEAAEMEEVVAEPKGIPTMYIAAAGAAAVILFGLFFVVLRRRRTKQSEPEMATTLPMTVGELQAELPSNGETPDQLGKPGRLEELTEDATPLDRASTAAASDTELAARVLRTWLAVPGAGQPAANDQAYSEAA